MTCLPRFSRAELVFSLKCLGAAALAFYVASRAGLPRPFWALMTTYIVAHPLASNVRSKAFFRLLGTLLGCMATVWLIPPLSGSPELLSLALAVWTGVCLYLSLLDRSARSYVFLLAGYSAALSGFPLVEAPASMFDTASARVEEISIGIMCASLVHSLMLPVGLGQSLFSVLDRSMADVRRWIGDTLTTRRRATTELAAKQASIDLHRLSLDVTQLRLLSTHVPFDTGNLRWAAGAILAMQDRMAELTCVLLAIGDRLDALEEAEGQMSEDVRSALEKCLNGILSHPSERSLKEMSDAVHSMAVGSAPCPWVRALRLDLAVRLRELHMRWDEGNALRQQIDADFVSGTASIRWQPSHGHRVLYRDKGLALRSAAAAIIATCIACAIWIVTGWPVGSAAAMSAAVFSSFFATMDDPVPAMHGFIVALIWSMPVTVFYVLVALPWARNFEMLVVAIAPLLLLIGCYLMRPAQGIAALGMFFGVIGTLALHDIGSADLVTFLQSNIAIFMGALVAARTTAIVRSVSADWSAKRLQRASLRDLNALASSAISDAAAAAFAGRMLDRIALLIPRASRRGAVAGEVALKQAILELNLGAAIATKHLPQEIRKTLMNRLESVLSTAPAQAVIAHASLLSAIDQHILKALQEDELSPAIPALVGLRRSLFPAAPTSFAS